MVSRILCIDDLTPAQWLVSTFLSRAGFEVLSSGDPDDTALLARVIQPDAIVLDPAVADHRGWEVLAELESDLELGRIPVLIYTALPEWAIADHAARCLYDDLRYVSKEEDLDRLLDSLAEVTGSPALVATWSA